jgi:hypothetical protein
VHPKSINEDVDRMFLESLLQADIEENANSKGEHVNVSEICIFCNLTKVFKKYESSGLNEVLDHTSVIQPTEVRHAL